MLSAAFPEKFDVVEWRTQFIHARWFVNTLLWLADNRLWSLSRFRESNFLVFLTFFCKERVYTKSLDSFRCLLLWRGNYKNRKWYCPLPSIVEYFQRKYFLNILIIIIGFPECLKILYRRNLLLRFPGKLSLRIS